MVPLIVYTSILHSNSQDRDRLLKLLFNLYKKPSFYQRRVLLHACLAFAKQSGPIRVHAELLPQCWENLSNKIDERRCFVAETCGILSPHLSVRKSKEEKRRSNVLFSSPFRSFRLERHSRQFNFFNFTTNVNRRQM